MVTQNDDTPEAESRPPQLTDLVALAQALNQRSAKYVIIGGIAMIQQGFTRGHSGRGRNRR